ncbi:MAG: SDR family NAD(P)-dependent oxidoreductase [Geminicoccales bacterium]
MQLDGQIALVTGAGQGIGKAICLKLADAGADIAAVDINQTTVNALKPEIEILGRRFLSLTADVGDIRAIDKMVHQTIKHFGRIDIAVNNAGVTRRAFIMDLTEDDWDRTHRVNAKGVFFCLQRVAKEMIEQGGGRIINIASIAGKGFEGTSNAAYAASKGAVLSLTKTAAQQLGPHNITVNAVCPGVTQTEMYQEIAKVNAAKEGISVDDILKSVSESIPLRRMSQPQDIADTVVFLASPAAHNISGQSLNVDGALVPH